MAIGLPEEYTQVTELQAAAGGSRSECEKAVVGFTHAELSAAAMEQWNLPEEIRIAVLYHDAPELAPPGSEGLNLSTVIHASNGYVCAIGYHINDGPQPTIDAAIRAWKR